jgi:hypothetical protein
MGNQPLHVRVINNGLPPPAVLAEAVAVAR